MNLNDLSTQLLYTTIPLWAERGDREGTFATGFVASIPAGESSEQSVPFLVTTRHVLEGARRLLAEFFQREGDRPSSRRVRASIPADTLLQFSSADLDLAAIPIGPLLNQLDTSGRGAFFRSITQELVPPADLLESLAAVETVTVIGYVPGIYEVGPLVPIARRAVTATPVWNDFEDTPTFLVDVQVHPGFSGSPVYLLNEGAFASGRALTVGSRVFLLGVLRDSVTAKDNPAGEIPPLGRVVRTSAVWNFLAGVVSQLLYTQRGA